MSDKDWFTVGDIEKDLHVPAATVRRYIRNHGHHLHMKKQGKSYLIAADSINVVQKMRSHYEAGKSQEQVEKELLLSDHAMTVEVVADDERMSVDVGQALQDMRNLMHEQSKMIQSLSERLSEREERDRKREEERDRKLLEVLDGMLENRKLSNESINKEDTQKDPHLEKKKWWEWWK
jgi:RNase H-fold protein (predicted Holliday junction resolvase)